MSQLAGKSVRVSRWLVLFPLVVLSGCTCARSPAAPDASPCDCSAAVAVVTPVKPPASRQEPTSESPHVHPLAVCDAQGRLPLDAAQEAFDAAQYEKALSCAAQAAALEPGNVIAHTERANALAELGRHDEASLAYARALAIDPDSLDALVGAAHFYTVLMHSSREMDELGSTYSERGFDLAVNQHENALAVSFARLSAMAFNDIGQSSEALERAEWVLEHQKGDPEAAYERAVALFELCRFKDARAAFTPLLNDPERAAWAHHHLGLIAERDGQPEVAEKHFAQAEALDAASFPRPVAISAEAFAAQVKKAIASLPDDMRDDLEGIPVEPEEIPDEVDLTTNDPPLSPGILGLFRGTPLGEHCELEPGTKPGTPCRSIALYRKNLARAVKTRDELDEQIRVTLLHEVGHLRGEDDSELAARGLE